MKLEAHERDALTEHEQLEEERETVHRQRSFCQPRKPKLGSVCDENATRLGVRIMNDVRKWFFFFFKKFS